MLTDETRYKILRQLQANPELSQRQLARALGISLGKVNYCLSALAEKGWIKAANFRNSRNKRGYLYELTPRGLEAKAKLTVQFLKVKQNEYETIKAEIEMLKQEAGQRVSYKSRG